MSGSFTHEFTYHVQRGDTVLLLGPVVHISRTPISAFGNIPRLRCLIPCGSYRDLGMSIVVRDLVYGVFPDDT